MNYAPGGWRPVGEPSAPSVASGCLQWPNWAKYRPPLPIAATTKVLHTVFNLMVLLTLAQNLAAYRVGIMHPGARHA